MAISIITVQQLNCYLTEVNTNNNTSRWVWRDSGNFFNGIVLYSSSVKGYFANGQNVRLSKVFWKKEPSIDDEIEEWLNLLSEEDKMNALFRLDEWNRNEAFEAVDFYPLVNKVYDLYLPKNAEISRWYNNFHCFKLNDRTFSVIEDEQDGYRSSLDRIDEIHPSLEGFFKDPIATVYVQYTDFANRGPDDFVGYRFIDINTKYVWLKFGTDNTDDYYPWFVYEVKIP